MPAVRFSLASVPRGTLLLGVGAWTTALHAVHLVLLVATCTPAHLGPIAASTLVWLGLTAWGWCRRDRMSPVELAAALSAGGAAISVDGVFGGAPGHAYLVSAGLLALVLGLNAVSAGPWTRLGTAFLLVCQGALLLGTLGSGPLALYVTVTTVLTTAGSGVLVGGTQEVLQRLVAAVDDEASHDPLTGLLNRRGMALRFPSVRAAAPDGHAVAAVVLDLDRFKRINDVHGHDAGDRVLEQVAEVLRLRARREDLVVRLGGEELAWIGSWPSAQDAVAAADDLRRAVSASPSAHGEPVTTSIGVALTNGAARAGTDDQVLSRLLVGADAALYEAKRAGRDRVVLAPPEAGDASPARPARL
ncbi:MAG: GGDEF domain-containing protein [Quadrisphaera sp.]